MTEPVRDYGAARIRPDCLPLPAAIAEQDGPAALDELDRATAAARAWLPADRSIPVTPEDRA